MLRSKFYLFKYCGRRCCLEDEVFLHPIGVLGDLDVDAGHVGRAAADAPAHQAAQVPATLLFADERAASITLLKFKFEYEMLQSSDVSVPCKRLCPLLLRRTRIPDAV